MEIYGFGLPMISQFPPLAPPAMEPPKSLKRAIPEDKDSEEESFQPDYHHMKKLGLKVNKKKIQTGSWSALENQIYLKFMMENIEDFLSQKARRTTKVFYRLSKILKRRTPDQCRSHHQKLQMKYQDDLNGIMQEVLRKIQRTIAEDFVNQQHRLHRPSFICFKDQMKTRLSQEQNNQAAFSHANYILNFDWYGIKVSGSCVQIEIKEGNIQGWAAN